jgi:hypothetical protein
MSIRTTRKIVKFSNPFSIEGIDRVLPAGNYEVVTDEELIEGLSFPVYRRVATMLLAPTQSAILHRDGHDRPRWGHGRWLRSG